MSKPIDFKTRFNKEILPALQKELGVKNIMAVPKVKMVKINVGIGTYIKAHGKDFEPVIESVRAISGQKPIVTKSKKAISNFKIRKGDPVGITVSLRGNRMYDFLNKLINVVFPRVRDFRGLDPKGIDAKGNFNVGFKEHTVFPEISPDDVMRLHGLQVSISTTAKNAEQGLALFKALGFPFKKNNKQ